MRVVLAFVALTLGACVMPMSNQLDSDLPFQIAAADEQSVELPELALRALHSHDRTQPDALAILDAQSGAQIDTLLEDRVCQVVGGRGAHVIAVLFPPPVDEPSRAPCGEGLPPDTTVFCMMEEILVYACRLPLVDIDVTTGEITEIEVDRADGALLEGKWGAAPDGTLYTGLSDESREDAEDVWWWTLGPPLDAVLVGNVREGFHRVALPRRTGRVDFADRLRAVTYGPDGSWTTEDGGREWMQVPPDEVGARWDAMVREAAMSRPASSLTWIEPSVAPYAIRLRESNAAACVVPVGKR